MRKLLAAALAIAWVISLALPVAVVAADNIWPGYSVLIMGPLGAMMTQFAWFANLLLLPALIFLARERPPLMPSIAIAAPLALLALNALTWDRVYGSNTEEMIQSYGPGYYLWLGVMLVAAAALVVKALAARKTISVGEGQIAA